MRTKHPPGFAVAERFDRSWLATCRAGVTGAVVVSVVGLPVSWIEAPRVAAQRLGSFIEKQGVRTLNIAGPRDSEQPDIGPFVRHVLGRYRGPVFAFSSGHRQAAVMPQFILPPRPKRMSARKTRNPVSCARKPIANHHQRPPALKESQQDADA